ncbi:MAG: NfeD family protein [Leptolyngbya sp. SIO1E4]|nr:NfeD family protein [Leptolyngbya sp. SIO1E4]
MFLIPEITEISSSAEIAKVLRVITSEDAGRIRFQGTDWPARFHHPDSQMSAPPSAMVRVVGRQGLTLLVEPLWKQPTNHRA